MGLTRHRSGCHLCHVGVCTLLALILSFCLGCLDEIIQAILPNRVFDIRDIFFNTVAVIMIIGARWLLTTVRRWVSAQLKQH